jgi:hypothetical protein
MGRTTPIIISALALAGCSHGAPSIHIDLSRSVGAESISIYFCPPQLATMPDPIDRCTYAGNPFEFLVTGNTLSTTAVVDVPSGNSPVGLALVGDSVSMKECHRLQVDLALPSDEVDFSAAVDGTGLTVSCAPTVCESDSSDCSSVGLP